MDSQEEHNHEEQNQIQAELKDIIDSINRFAIANKQKVCFVGGFLAFNEGVCDDCQEQKDDIVRKDASHFFAYGDIDDLRMMLNDLRDMSEDSKDKRGWVNC